LDVGHARIHVQLLELDPVFSNGSGWSETLHCPQYSLQGGDPIMQTVVIYLTHGSSVQMVDLVYRWVHNGWWVKGWCMWGETKEWAILTWCTFHSVAGRNLCNFSLCKGLYSKELSKTGNLSFLW
jgi:hypothetical protein